MILIIIYVQNITFVAFCLIETIFLLRFVFIVKLKTNFYFN